jgi:hypothetical protein
MILFEYDETHGLSLTQPPNTGIVLKRHQMVLLERCLKVEHFKPEMTKRRAVIGDKAGSGKSFVVLSIINLRRGTNALVIPEHLVSQWIGFLEAYGGISYVVVRDSLDLKQAAEKDLVIIVKPSTTGDGTINDRLDSLAFDRVFYDGTPNVGRLGGQFTWIVSDSYLDYQQEEIVVLKNRDSFVDRHMALPDLEERVVVCRSLPLEVLGPFLDEPTASALNALDFPGALAGIGKEHPSVECHLDRFIVERESAIKRVLKRQLDPRLARWQAIRDQETVSKTSEEREARLKLEIADCQQEIDRLKGQIDSVRERMALEGGGETGCPSRSCNRPEENFLESNINESGDENNRSEKCKTCAVTSILSLRPNRNGRFLVFSDHSGGFCNLKGSLEKLPLVVRTVSKEREQNFETIRAFRQGQVQVLLVDSDICDQELSFEFVTDLISIHDTPSLTAVIARAQRPGRKTPLKIWKLRHGNEV